MTTLSQPSQFSGRKYLTLQTFRKNGDVVATPVWFANDPQDDGVVYVRTFEKTGKVKRLRREPRVRVAPCDAKGTPEGEWVDGEARIVVPQSEEAQRANRLLNQKYGLMKRVVEPAFGLKYGKVVTIAVRLQ